MKIEPGRNHEVVLSHAYWRQHFGGEKILSGGRCSYNGEAYTVIGVMPSSFTYPIFAQVWTPLAFGPEERNVRGIHDYLVVARLKPGVSCSRQTLS